MGRRNALKLDVSALAGLYLSPLLGQSHIHNTPVFKETFEPTWDSLEKYQVPDWFRDAKFGMWAHLGPQCEPEAGDVVELGMEGLGTSKQVAVAYSKNHK